MNLEQLKERMSGFIQSDYRAYLFENEARIIGYALVNYKKEPLYLRQFFICRDVRRNGYGTIAFQGLLTFLGTKAISLEVLVWNQRGIEFWKSLGFIERSVEMRLEVDL